MNLRVDDSLTLILLVKVPTKDKPAEKDVICNNILFLIDPTKLRVADINLLRCLLIAPTKLSFTVPVVGNLRLVCLVWSPEKDKDPDSLWLKADTLNHGKST